MPARFQAVTGQLDPGGVVHAYVSVDGDLTAIGGYVNSMMDEMRKIEPSVPAVKRARPAPSYGTRRRVGHGL